MKAAKNRTSDKVATLSGRVMAELREARKTKGGTKKDASDFVTLAELWALAASCLVQDEVKGPRERKDKRRKV